MTDYKNMSGHDWFSLLRNQPQFSKHCDWDKLDGYWWGALLRHQPQFSKHCDWDKLDGEDWHYLLPDYPQWIVHCKWDKFTENDWIRLLRNHSGLCLAEELQLAAVSKVRGAFELLVDPSERCRKLNQIKWKL